ncbi:MAG: MBL fold metallo-hydrolase [Bradymonadaceae bacterium]
MPSQFSVKIYGCRGSIPVTGSEHVKYGGATSCVVVKAGNREIVLDGGSGIVTYGRELAARRSESGQPINRTLFFSHVHFDHVMGLPYFSPLYMVDTTLYLFGPRSNRFESFEDTLDTLIQSPFYPVALHEMHAQKHFVDFTEPDVVYFLKGRDEPLKMRPGHPSYKDRIPSPEVIEAEVHCMRGYNHPKSGVNLYKVICDGRSFVYATDTEGFVHGDRRLIRFAENTELVLHDAMYTESHYTSTCMPTQGYGHSTVEIAADLAKKSGAKRLGLFHHDPKSTDDHLDRIEELGQSLFPESFAARDGLEIIL